MVRSAACSGRRGRAAVVIDACFRNRRHQDLRLTAPKRACSACCPGVIGLLQATEAIKLILGIGESLSGTLLQFDALGMRSIRLRLLRDPACPRCGDGVKAGDYVDLPAAC